MNFNEINKLNLNVSITQKKDNGVKKAAVEKQAENIPAQKSPVNPNYWQGAIGIKKSSISANNNAAVVQAMTKIKSDVEIPISETETTTVSEYINYLLAQTVGFETDEEYQQYIIESFTKNLEGMKKATEAQEDKEGLITKGYDAIKELTGLGICDKDAEEMIKKQEEMINALQAAMRGEGELSFEQIYEQYTGIPYSKERIDKYMENANIYSAMMVGMQYDGDYAKKFKEATGKKIKEVTKEYAQIQSDTFGNISEIQKISEKYLQDKEGFKDKLSTIVSTAGMGCIVAGAIISFVCPAAAPVGISLMTAGKSISLGGMFVDNALDIADKATDKDGLTKNEVGNIALETGVEAISYGVGRKIGGFTNKLNINVTNKAIEKGTSEVVSRIAGQTTETTVDTALSLGADYVIAQGQSLITTGKFMNPKDYWSMERFLGEGKNQLIGILTGLSSTKINAYQQGIITTAQGKILEGDIEGAKSYLKQSGMKMKDESFDAFVEQVRVTSTQTEQAIIETETKVQEPTDQKAEEVQIKPEGTETIGAEKPLSEAETLPKTDLKEDIPQEETTSDNSEPNGNIKKIGLQFFAEPKKQDIAEDVKQTEETTSDNSKPNGNIKKIGLQFFAEPKKQDTTEDVKQTEESKVKTTDAERNTPHKSYISKLKTWKANQTFKRNCKKQYRLSPEQTAVAMKLRKQGFCDESSIYASLYLSQEQIDIAIKLRKSSLTPSSDDLGDLSPVKTDERRDLWIVDTVQRYIFSDEIANRTIKLKEKGFDDDIIIRSAYNLTDEQVDTAIGLKEKGFSDYTSIGAAKELSPEQIDTAVKLKEKEFSDYNSISAVKELSPEQIDTAIKLKEKEFSDYDSISAVKELSPEQIDNLIKMKESGITDYYALKTVKKHPQAKIDKLIELKERGFDDSIALSLVEDFSAEQIDSAIRLNEHGFAGGYVMKYSQEYSAEQIDIAVKLKAAGLDDKSAIDCAYHYLPEQADVVIKMQEKGFDTQTAIIGGNFNLSDQQIDAAIRLQKNGFTDFIHTASALSEDQVRLAIDLKNKGYEEGATILGARRNISEEQLIIVNKLKEIGLSDVYAVEASFKFTGEQFETINQLKQKGFKDDNIITAIRNLPAENIGVLITLKEVGFNENIAISAAKKLSPEQIEVAIKLKENDFNEQNIISNAQKLSIEQADYAIKLQEEGLGENSAAFAAEHNITEAQLKTAKELRKIGFMDDYAVRTAILFSADKIEAAKKLKEKGFSDHTINLTLKDLSLEQIDVAIKLKEEGFGDYISSRYAKELSTEQINTAVKLRRSGFNGSISTDDIKALTPEQTDTAIILKSAGAQESDAIKHANGTISQSILSKMKEKGFDENMAIAGSILRFSDEQIDTATKLKENGFKEGIIRIIRQDFTPEQTQRAIKLKENGLDDLIIIECIKNDLFDYQIESVKQLKQIGFSDDNAIRYGKMHLSEREIEIATELKRNGFDDTTAVNGAYANMSKQDINNATRLINEGFDGYSALTGSGLNLTDEQIGVAKEIKEKLKEYSYDDLNLIKLATLSPDAYSKIEKYLTTNNERERFRSSDFDIVVKFAPLCEVNNINEIPLSEKRNFVKELVASNTGLFIAGETIREAFPILPRSQEEYCALLPALVRSLGIETNPLTDVQTKEFNSSLANLGKALRNLSNDDFNNLNVTQAYSKNSFITDVLAMVKNLPDTERQKVFDYFGFELKLNSKSKTGYSIYGYPVNLNNGKKLAQITDANTQTVVEALRPYVIKFSKENPISCSNKQVETLLNQVVKILPEIRTEIGRVQSPTHSYDVMTHSLKVMKELVSADGFKNLSESDQKIMLLASLFHDITKIEGKTDVTHPTEGGFDTFFIGKKFSLSKDEEIKLYTIIKNHEWLAKINTAPNDNARTKLIHDTAYDLRHDNLLELSLMFTQADLKSVKKDGSFATTTEGRSRTNFEGVTRSYSEAAEFYAQKVKKGITELQKSQPILPITKIPTADVIKNSVTRNADGSTNIKGVYIDDNGLVIIKYNEVEDWDAIGFPKGSISRGITTTTDNGTEINTGNIKFIAHGLDYENQLAKFDAFGLINSDALLSISYMERPESKFRLFRPQGLLLNIDTKYIHGGGNTDSGSGCGKDIQNFKDRYIFGAERESDRLYISNLVKSATGMSDTEYIDFVEKYQNKPFSEIEPVDTRNKIIKAFASINSNIRKGNREYNEMYGSNPVPMAVFAYDINTTSNVGNPISFLASNNTVVNTNGKKTSVDNHARTAFLQKYAIEHNLPFIVFGD